MPHPPPPTLTEAKKLGTSFRGSEEERGKYGYPDSQWDAAIIQPGLLCAAHDCINGLRLVAYGDSSGGCTEEYEVPC